MSEVRFKEKFIGFVDILGFKGMTAAAERAGATGPLAELLEIMQDLGTYKDSERYADYGPMVCPAAPYTRKDLDFQVTQISDCIIVSAEVSPAGIINLGNWGRSELARSEFTRSRSWV